MSEPQESRQPDADDIDRPMVDCDATLNAEAAPTDAGL